MAWEKRRRKRYYYSTRRRGNRVISEHLTVGERARAAIP